MAKLGDAANQLRDAQAALRVKAAGASETWNNITVWPLFALSIAFFALSVWSFAEDLPSSQDSIRVAALLAGMWLLFLAALLVAFVLAPDRRMFLRLHWFEILTLVVPYLRPFVVVVYLWRLPLLRRPGIDRYRLMICTSVFSLVFVYAASSAVWLFEHDHPGASIVNLGDAIWWGFTTITTVGYGDFVPVTIIGRSIAVLLMVGGIFVVGVTSGTVISALTAGLNRSTKLMEQEHRERAIAQTRARTLQDADTEPAGAAPADGPPPADTGRP